MSFSANTAFVRRPSHVLGSSLLALGCLFVCTSAARAEQFTTANVTYTHSAETTDDSHYRVPPMAGSPSNWKSPVDYANGSVHVLLEVKTKPTTKETRFQICFEATPNYACTNQSETYTKPGKLEWDTKFADMWQPDPENNPVDWSKGVRQVALILKDNNNGKPQGKADYVPTDLHVEVTVVSSGATFAPGTGAAPIAPPLGDAGARPARPDAGTTPGADAGSETAATDAGSSKPALDAGPQRTPDAAARDAGKPAPSDDEQDDGDTRSDASTSTKDGGADKPDEDAGGCSVASHGSGGLPLGLSLMMFGLLRRRRAT